MIVWVQDQIPIDIKQSHEAQELEEMVRNKYFVATEFQSEKMRKCWTWMVVIARTQGNMQAKMAKTVLFMLRVAYHSLKSKT